MIAMQITISSRNSNFKNQIPLFEEKRFSKQKISTLLSAHQIPSESRPKNIYENKNN